jgi:hypothetical protein
MQNPLFDLAKGEFKTGLAKLNQKDKWQDDRTDLSGPFRLKFPEAEGWGESLLLTSLLKREAINTKTPVKVFADWQVCSILKQDSDSVFDAVQGEGDKEVRSPLAILRHALAGKLLDKPFIPLKLPGGPFPPTTNRRPQIGIAWASITDGHPIDQKSIALEPFLSSLADISGEFVSLQRNLRVADPDGLLREFGDRIVRDEVLNARCPSSLATLVEEIRQLDCLVTISTTTTHLAASLGIPVELIAAERKGPQWFWEAQAHHKRCFYPTVNVHIGDGETGNWWEKCLKEVTDSLSGLRKNNG